MARRNALAILLCTLVFAVFYVSVFADICVVDDFDNLMAMHNGPPLSLRELFLPRSAQGGYYRPLIGLSYLVNLRLWDLDGRTLHLENVLMHVAVVLMVFLLAREVLKRQGREGTLAPLVAGLLFGLHPIVTESVDWISGRTDLIAGFFVFLAALLVVRFTRTGSWYLVAAAGLSVLAGLLGKETALGFIPGALFLMTAHREQDAAVSADPSRLSPYHELLLFLLFAGGTVAAEVVFYNFWTALCTAPLYLVVRHSLNRAALPGRDFLAVSARRLAAGAVGLAGAAAVFYGVRKLVFSSDMPRFPQTVKLMLQNINYTIEIFLGGGGFYVKKYFCPFPLNFAIREVDPFYPLIGTLVVFLVLLVATRRTMASSLVLAGVFLFAPALPLALGTVAWTAYAERYIYISAGFWSIALVLWLAPRFERYGRAGMAVVILLLLFMGGATLQRNLIWQKNFSLVKDTVEKSPRFREVHVIYMSELMKAGDLAGAREQYRIANSLPCVFYNERLDSLMAELCIREGKPDEALRLYRKILERTRGKSAAARQQVSTLLKERIAQAKGPAQRRAALLELQRFEHPDPDQLQGHGAAKVVL